MVASSPLSLSGMVPKNEEMTLMDHSHGLEMMNGNGDEAMPFGETNLIMSYLNPLLH
ncbi:unnamed protein product [Lupinus luteus]|uniref:Uncharacterized protein n=1 Tax=Lupinus luteus TaxID=3873 RepID=A0AAV1XGY3_LUPLU